MASKIQVRRGTAAEWTAANPVLIVGELGFETDTNKIKAGDGTTAWTALAYYYGAVQNLTGHITSTGAASILGSFTLAQLNTAISDADVATGGGTATGTNTGDQTNISGNAATVTTNANLTGGVTSVGNAATVITNANLTGVVTSTGNATAIADAALAIAKTSGLQAALDAKQASDAALTALAAGSDFVQFTGPTTTTKVFTLPDASSTLLVSGGALGTPSGGTATNLTGTASGLTVGNVTTNANLTGHVVSVGNAAVLGSFTVAQLNTAISDADVATGGGTASNSNTGDQTNISGNAATVTTNANLTGVVTSTGNATAIADSALSIAKTSGLQTALDAKQPIDAALTALAAGSDFVQFTGPITTTKIFTLPDSSSTLLVSGGALGTPSSGTATNLTGTAAGLTVGSAGTVTTAAQPAVTSVGTLTDLSVTGEVTAGGYELSSSGFNAQTASYSLTSADNGKIVTMNVGSANNLTIPTGLGTGFNCTIIQLGAGQTTIVAAGTTLNSYLGYLKIGGQHASASIVAYSSNILNIAGNLVA